MTTIYHSTFATPFGDFSIAVNDSGAVVATAFGDRTALARRVSGIATLVWVVDEDRTAVARKQVRDYIAGERQVFSLRLAPPGTEFQRRVWAELRRIPFGGTCTYGDVARRLGSSPRAVGRANGANPICLVVPCHRVIGADGSLTGFAFGTGLKQRLLALEADLVRTGRRRKGSRRPLTRPSRPTSR